MKQFILHIKIKKIYKLVMWFKWPIQFKWISEKTISGLHRRYWCFNNNCLYILSEFILKDISKLIFLITVTQLRYVKFLKY